MLCSDKLPIELHSSWLQVWMDNNNSGIYAAMHLQALATVFFFSLCAASCFASSCEDYNLRKCKASLTRLLHVCIVIVYIPTCLGERLALTSSNKAISKTKSTNIVFLVPYVEAMYTCGTDVAGFKHQGPNHGTNRLTHPVALQRVDIRRVHDEGWPWWQLSAGPTQVLPWSPCEKDHCTHLSVLRGLNRMASSHQATKSPMADHPFWNTNTSDGRTTTNDC